MVAQWMVLLSVASLAFGSALRGDGEGQKREFLLPIECCDYEKVIGSILATDKAKCGGAVGKALLFKDDNKAGGGAQCAADCALGERGLLAEDGSVKGAELKKLLVDGADGADGADAKTVLRNALDACLEELKEEWKVSGGGGGCKSGADELVFCVVNGFLAGCPNHMWFADKQQCRRQ